MCSGPQIRGNKFYGLKIAILGGHFFQFSSFFIVRFCDLGPWKVHNHSYFKKDVRFCNLSPWKVHNHSYYAKKRVKYE